MIAVIADDFTGAAEIGGIGLRHGLKVVIETKPVPNGDADLLVIATDSRSKSCQEAERQIADVVNELMKFKPEYIYKKIDSVFRGHVIPELLVQMNIMKKERAVVVAANPIFNRTIKNGIYYINDVPLHQSNFTADKRYPQNTASVLDILNNGYAGPIVNCKPADPIPEKGIVVGDVCCIEDLKKWKKYNQDNTLLAGASGLFNELLETSGTDKNASEESDNLFGESAMLVLGSTFPKANSFLNQLKEQGYYISNMPEEIYYNANFDVSELKKWADDIAEKLREKTRVVVTVLHKESNELRIMWRIKSTIGILIKMVLDKASIDDLFIEGGSTVSEILDQLGIVKLIPNKEYNTGVIRMETQTYPNMHIITKPGSYNWPKALLNGSKMNSN